LCGGLITNLNRKTGSFIVSQKIPVTMVSVGRKGIDFMRRYGRETRAEFTGLGDRPTLLDTLAISRIIIDDYTNGLVDEVYVAYTKFVSTMVQTPVIEKLLPIEPPVSTQAKTLILTTNRHRKTCSKHCCRGLWKWKYTTQSWNRLRANNRPRMVAMRSATDNAAELIQDFTLML